MISTAGSQRERESGGGGGGNNNNNNQTDTSQSIYIFPSKKEEKHFSYVQNMTFGL